LKWRFTAPALELLLAAQILALGDMGGRIINMGCVSAKTPRSGPLPYTTTKFAIRGMTHQLTMDGRKHNIVVSIIHPGATLSPFSTGRGQTQAGPAPRRLRHGRRRRGQVRAADGRTATRGEAVRGNDPAQPHAVICWKG
jgi:NAD(P)-dependent dehydrogenase (short-subunit alcohol dehydrogenase family)